MLRLFTGSLQGGGVLNSSFLWWRSLKQMFEVLVKQNELFKNLLKNFPNTKLILIYLTVTEF